MKIRPVALMPMRHASERVPSKNFRNFNGKPLFHHVLSQLCMVDRIEKIVIDTDSEFIAEQVRGTFPQVVLIQRAEHLLGGEVPMTEVLRYDAEQVPSQWYLQTHSTNPLLRAETIEAAIADFERNIETHDSLFSVTPIQTRLYDSSGRAVNHDPRVLLRTQDLPPLYEENSNIYIFSRELISRGARIGENPILYSMDALESLDIDTEADFEIAEAAYRALYGTVGA